MGRIGVDLYPQQIGVSLREVRTFGKFLGGSAANVAVAAARYGRRSAMITRTGDDPFGAVPPRRAARLRGRRPLRHPGARRCRPRSPSARSSRRTTSRSTSTASRRRPTWRSRADELDLDAIRDAGVFWITGTGLCQEPSPVGDPRRAARPRQAPAITVFDLDYRPMFWPSREEARALVPAGAAARRRSPSATSTSATPRSASGSRARPPTALHDAGVELAVVKQGPAGVLASRGGEEVEVPPVPVEVVNGLGAGDAFGGALCHGLLAGWDLETMMRFCNAAGAIVASPAVLRRRHADRGRGPAS